MSNSSHKSSSGEYQYIPLDDNDKFFYTYDLGCSAALLSKNFELVSIDRVNPKKVLFIFSRRKNDIEKVANDYWMDRLEVKARSFFDHLKAIKNKLYSNNHS